MPPEKTKTEINGLRVVQTMLHDHTTAERRYVTADGRIWDSITELSQLSQTGMVIGTLRKTK